MSNKKINKKCFSLSEQIFFTQRLSLLLNSGISMVEALSIMKNIENSKSRKLVYESLIENTAKGMSLTKSIKTIDLRLNYFLISLIQNGEMVGNLSETLMKAHLYLEKKNEMKKKIVSSLIYPVFIVFATILMTLFLILYIFPKIIPLLKSLDITLPLITRIVQSLYYFIISYGIYFVISIFVLVILIRFAIKKVESIRYRFHLLFISIPFINKYIKIYLVSSLCGIGEILLSSGKGLPDVILLSKEAYKNVVYKKILDDIYRDSIKGISFYILLKKHQKFFPDILPDMCSLGERTGNLGAMLGHCSRIFEQDIENFLKRFISLIEPVLMVFMGLIVGSIALSIILPVYEITNHLSK